MAKWADDKYRFEFDPAYNLTLGLPLRNPFEFIEAGEVEGMKRRIQQERMHSTVIHRVMTGAELAGIPPGDMYVWLAYIALLMLETEHRQLMKILETLPAPPVLVPLAELLKAKQGNKT